MRSTYCSDLVTIIADFEEAHQDSVSSIFVDDTFHIGGRRSKDTNEQLFVIHFRFQTEGNTTLTNKLMFVIDEIDLKMQLSSEDANEEILIINHWKEVPTDVATIHGVFQTNLAPNNTRTCQSRHFTYQDDNIAHHPTLP